MIAEILSFISRYLPYIVLFLGVFGVPSLIVFGWMKFYRNKTVVELCRNIDGRFHIVKTAKINNTLELYTFKDKDYKLDYKYAVMKNNILNGHYASFRFDIEDAKPLLTDTCESPNFKTFSPTLLHKVMKTNIYAQILTGVADSQFIIIIVILSALSLALSGYGVYVSIQSQAQTKTLIELLTKGLSK